MFSEKPGPPSHVTVTNVGKNIVTIQWGAPRNDGGSMITRYHISLSKCSRTSWDKVTTVKSFVSEYTFTDLEEGVEYFFGIAAENDIGVGQMRKTEEAIRPKKQLGKLEINCWLNTQFTIRYKI